MENLFAPWRYTYLVQESQEKGCVFCNALEGAAEEEKTLVIYRARRNFVILNLYPYNNGHLMIVPNDHVASPSESTAEQRHEMTELAAIGEDVLKTVFRAEGLNLGMNLGRAAGAGIEHHYHLHMVPRWSGDTNFMTVMAGTRVIPEDLRKTRERLRRAFLERMGAEAGRDPGDASESQGG